MKSEFKENLIYGLKQIGVVVGIIILVYVLLKNFSIHQVVGDSMEPTFSNGDYILVSNNAVPDNMDVVIIDTNLISGYEAEGESAIKRYYEDYSNNGYFVLGDNSEISYDSRYYGEAPKESCTAVVLYNFTKGFDSIAQAIKNIF